ncbi:aminotransferase class III-fold pyridoxal phosphate-dependent enzyme [Lysinibacillus sp. Bpr_S20]|uniref:aminotransferase family protein n=1 Tax=Lysinibacillus sp. Bpr_S20 TaxID=2933964 RepID=UPI002011C44D|nr:aminotransferase class III-fold pyridoxal phosphate-dependent enzyme [Lysinibacillus sp. Bpr_S20]MCL1702460.1 aminotransferase class III-fold pyridoxal phosphate-dependent enzyme [Lysinibacillus sp. Bpr_S20]
MLKDSDFVFHRDFNTNYPIITHGEGSFLFTEDGESYIDGSSGAVAANLGHSNENIAKAMYDQAMKVGFVHTMRFETNLLHLTSQKIIDLAPEKMESVFFCSGGSEANESALKLCRQINRDRGKATKFISIGRWQSYHGNTIGSLSVGGDVQRRYPYSPLLNKTEHIDAPYYPPHFSEEDKIKEDERCLNQLRRVVNEVGAESISAIIVEPIVGSQQGAMVPTSIYLKGIRKICSEFDIYMIVDEVMTGFYRTGESFAILHEKDVVPDIITFGKGVTAGYAPLAGMIVHENLIKQLKKFSDGKFLHGFTYSGHPVCLAAGYSAITEYENQNIKENIKNQSSLIYKRLNEIKKNSKTIGSIRGKGLLIGVEFFENKNNMRYFERGVLFAAKFNSLAMKKGAVFYPGSGGVDGTKGEHILIAPPLNITTADVKTLINIFEETLYEMEKNI